MITTITFTIWGNKDGCTGHYRFDIALYPLPMLSQTFNIIIGCDVSAPGHGKEVVDILNFTYKRFIFHLMATL